MAYFTHYWKYDTLDFHEELIADGDLPTGLDHTAGEQFHAREVRSRDWIYIVSFKQAQLRVVARLQVDRIVSESEAEQIFPYELWEASEHVVAVDGSGSPIRFDAVVAKGEVGAIRFIDADGARLAPKRDRHGDVNPQTFRGVRKITEATAVMFDKVLGV